MCEIIDHCMFTLYTMRQDKLLRNLRKLYDREARRCRYSTELWPRVRLPLPINDKSCHYEISPVWPVGWSADFCRTHLYRRYKRLPVQKLNNSSLTILWKPQGVSLRRQQLMKAFAILYSSRIIQRNQSTLLHHEQRRGPSHWFLLDKSIAHSMRQRRCVCEGRHRYGRSIYSPTMVSL